MALWNQAVLISMHIVVGQSNVWGRMKPPQEYVILLLSSNVCRINDKGLVIDFLIGKGTRGVGQRPIDISFEFISF